MPSILVKVQPILDEAKARRMENSLARRFQKVSKTFAGGLKNAVKFELHCGAIGLFMGTLLNPIKDYAEKMEQAPAKASDITTKANQFGSSKTDYLAKDYAEKMEQAPAKASDITTKANQFGSTNADYLALQTIAQAKGVDPETLISILSKLQQKIAQARQLSAQGKTSQLNEFKNETNIVSVFVKILNSLNAYGNKKAVAQRSHIQEQIFGQKLAEKLDPLFQADANKLAQTSDERYRMQAKTKETNDANNTYSISKLKAQQSTFVAKFGPTNADYLALQTIAQAKGVDPETLISILSKLQQKIAQTRQLSAQGKTNKLNEFENETNIVSVLETSARRDYDDYFEPGKTITTSSLVTQGKRKRSANELVGKKLNNYEMYAKLQETTSKLLLEVASIATLIKPLAGVANWQADYLPGLAKEIEEFIKNIPIKLDAIKNSFVGKLFGFRDN
jgi:predicted transcriptional regulator